MNNLISAKEQLLAKIRKALLNKRENMYAGAEEPAAPAPLEGPPEVHFAEQLNAAGGNFIYCENGIEFLEQLLALTISNNWKSIYCWDTLLQEILDVYEYPFIRSSHGINQAQVGITLAEALVARSGTVVVSSALGGGSVLPFFTQVHIVVAMPGQLVAEEAEAQAALRAKYGEDMPAVVCNITGPALSGGADAAGGGPKQLYVFLVEDFA